ncbi:ImmA/IrrE family metallo-endopeptidase [Pedobacter jeongneungensis]|uniref:ImmA/IrrE family metallo-endopeptidase n=1 Tax=Pedobacter jeongneungensis TaxID=947309 RepID=UPI000468D10F|nr:ImmA/IrrE family metallo-endopeptidase [Pedobacter jeongneungensis]
MTPAKKKRISELADFLSSEFAVGNLTDLIAAADSESLSIYFDHYESSFDGMLVHFDQQFHVHINLDKGNTKTSKRGRFTLAHELGHFFIDEHRIGLKYGLLQAHPSLNNLNHTSLIENEADYFASCLLMPENKYKAFCARKPFSFDLINSISDSFQTSLVASILRFIDIGSREFMVVVSRSDVVKWFSKSHDFPKFPFRFKVGLNLPKDTLSARYFLKPIIPYQSLIEEIDPESWFYINDNRANKTMYEQCYFSEINGYLVTLIWFK